MTGPAPPAMASPHLIRQYNATQLSLVAHDRTVAVLAVAGERYAGSAVLVHLPTLRSRLDWLPAEVDTVVVVDELLPDAATVGRVDDMLTVFSDAGADLLSQWVPATEALKLEQGGLVGHAVDRTDVVSLKPPLVVRRLRLGEAIRTAPDVTWVDPAAEVARVGGTIVLYEPSMLPSWLRGL
jgi:hypothetical protein